MLFLKSKGSQVCLVILFFILELSLISGLSVVSEYQLKRPGYFVNFDIMTMLTPFGLLKNLVFQTESSLRPYYFHLPSREGVFESLPTLLFRIAIPILALAALFYLKRKPL